MSGRGPTSSSEKRAGRRGRRTPGDRGDARDPAWARDESDGRDGTGARASASTGDDAESYRAEPTGARRRWLGLGALVRDAVVAGSSAVERLQKDVARRPFGLLERVTPIARPARWVHAVHDGTVTATHVVIRLVAQTAGHALEAALADAPPPPARKLGAARRTL